MRLIPIQWRAFDIPDEIEELGLAFESVPIDHDGRLVDVRHDSHPYGRAS